MSDKRLRHIVAEYTLTAAGTGFDAYLVDTVQREAQARRRGPFDGDSDGALWYRDPTGAKACDRVERGGRA